MRGDSYTEMVHVFHSISHALPSVADKDRSEPDRRACNVGGLAPGMNAAARAAVRLGLYRGHTMLGVHGSFRGLIDGDVRELQWGDVEGWTSRGGAELGHQPARADGQGPLRDRPRAGAAPASTGC